MKKKPLVIALSVIGACILLTTCGVVASSMFGDDTASGETNVEETSADPAATSAPAENSEAPSASGDIANFNFDPQQNGFSFPNYGSDIPATNLTSVEMRRMFGDQVCARLEGEECTLTPPAAQWMEQVNGAMGGGHCEGMAVLSLMLYTGQVPASDFGGSLASDLDINNEALQRELAYWWTTQATSPTNTSLVIGTPMEILNTVQQMDANGETYTMEFFNQDGTSGHAVNPIGVADKGDGVYAILVYDNNYPGQTREFYVDSRDNSWTYETSINPQVQSDVWSGNADSRTLFLTPTSARLGVQDCPFCGSYGSSSTGGQKFAAPEQKVNQIFLDGDGHILITDNNGNRLGYVNGKIINEIPGASYDMYVMGASMDAPEPTYSVPVDLDLTITVDGTALTEETLTDLVLIGPGYSIGVEEIYLTPGQVDTAYFYPRDETIAYETESDESPSIVFGIENPDAEADYYFEVFGADMVGGGIITAMLDTKAGDLVINTEKLNGEGNFNFYMTRISDEYEDEFSAEDIILKEGALVYINYAEWSDANPEGIYFGIDVDGDGTIDDEYVVDDATE
jgi:hypothetical protein